MKGRKLTLEEVLNLEDGSKVWVESKDYGNKGQISHVMTVESFYKSKNMRLSDFYDESSGFYSQDAFKNLEIFELIEVSNETVYNNMAQEICNLRGLDLTDENIEMYKIISVTDKDGNDKVEFMDELKSKHGDLSGEFVYFNFMLSGIENGAKPSCCFEWNDDSGKMLRTSSVESISEWDNKIKIVTRNSVYVFEEMGG